MPRVARAVFSGVAHHITQRGNRRKDVFYTDEDRQAYLDWLKEYSQKNRLEILAYCLMTNHIHLAGVPRTEEGLQAVLKPLHMRYAQRFDRERGWKGHVWQGRYFSSPLDEAYLWAAIRYVERNPVRAGMVKKQKGIPGPECWRTLPLACRWASESKTCMTTPVNTDSQLVGLAGRGR